jgi:hypothetical protein
LGFGLVDGIPVATARVFLNQTARHIVNLAVSTEGIQQDKEAGFMVIEFIDAGIEIRLCRKSLCAPTCRRKAPQQAGKNNNESTMTHAPHTYPEGLDLILTRVFPARGGLRTGTPVSTGDLAGIRVPSL